MIFLANIGNTNLSYGLFHQKIVASEYFPIIDLLTQRDIENLCHSLLKKYQLSPGQIKGAVLSSVVPGKTPMLIKAVKNSFALEPLLISDNTDWSFDYSAYSGLLGTDRLLVCQAAMKKYKPPFIAIDCGTASTLNVIDQAGSFLGGIILPGVLTGLQALTAKTSQLNPVSFSHPKSVIGKNTAECMLSGATYGTAALLEGLVLRIQEELDTDDVSVIITGGNSETIIPHCTLPLHYEPELLLEGLALKYLENNPEYKNKEAIS
ncbi:MAG: type III pantothenate kinase [Anaerocolumna sp.]